MIGIAVNKSTELDVLVPVLQNLNKCHGGYCVQGSRYDTVGAALLTTWGRGLGKIYGRCKSSLGECLWGYGGGYESGGEILSVITSLV